MKKCKIILNKYWDNDTKNFRICNYRNIWQTPNLYFGSNGAKRKNGDKCLDIKLIIGYTVINYTNFDLQRNNKKG